MASTMAAVKREYEIYGIDLEGDPCIYPRDVSQASFAQLTNYKSKTISKIDYDAFPYAVKLGTSIVGIFSTGVAHAQSVKQVMFRSDDNGNTFSFVDFLINDTGVFDTSLLQGILSDGDAVNLKVWNVKNVGGDLIVTTNSFSGDYAIWSKPKTSTSGLYRTGYNPNTWQTALLESLDNGLTWNFKSIIAPTTAGKTFNEADIVNTVPNNWIAYIREDTGAGDNLCRSISVDDGATWSAPTLVDTKLMNGRQPNLTKLDDGSIILATGDRTGASGYTASGLPISGTDATGITIFRTTDNGTTWSFRTRVSPMYSTDGGQPFVIDLGSGNVFITWYARNNIKKKPCIVSCTMNVTDI